MVKTVGTPRKINAILLSIKIYQPKLVNMCGHKLATNRLNFMEIHLAKVKMLQNVLGGYFFDSHCSLTISVAVTELFNISACCAAAERQ